jgi:hypothetical protein
VRELVVLDNDGPQASYKLHRSSPMFAATLAPPPGEGFSILVKASAKKYSSIQRIKETQAAWAYTLKLQWTFPC